MATKFGVLEFTNAFGKQETLPTYCCGHCSDVVVMRPDRIRERKHCTHCGKLICEKKELCQIDCTPIHSLAKDHFEGAGKWGKYVPALMAGCSTVDEGVAKGLIIVP